MGHENATKAPEGAAAGAGTGALLGGALGWAAGVGALAIPGLGPLIAAGPILATLSGIATGGHLLGRTPARGGTAIPDYQTLDDEGRRPGRNISISVSH